MGSRESGYEQAVQASEGVCGRCGLRSSEQLWMSVQEGKVDQGSRVVGRTRQSEKKRRRSLLYAMMRTRTCAAEQDSEYEQMFAAQDNDQQCHLVLTNLRLHGSSA